MRLVEKFKSELNRSRLFDYKDKILIGVSGGRDSMTLTHVLKECGYDIAIAHCNFSLRGDESDEEQEFVKRYAEENSVPFHTIKFDTLSEAAACGESIQIAARRLRYDWFDELLNEFGYSVVAIAHNSDDCAETFFINLTRGTGIKGLRGIRARRDKIVRPLLFATRAEITEFCYQASIEYRDDSSNSSDKYLRNKIRHSIMPLFKEINSDFNATMLATTENISRSNELFEFFIQKIRNCSLSVTDGVVKVDLGEIKMTPNPAYTLFEVIRDWGFSAEQCQKIICADFEQKSGLKFSSKLYELLLNRGELFIRKFDEICEIDGSEVFIDTTKPVVFNGYTIYAEILDISDLETLKTESNVAIFELAKLSMPIKVREFKDGDEFVPFGMRGTKKVSDFMIDKKLSVFEKERVVIFDSLGDIIWIAPYRIDNRFSVSECASLILRITCCL